jgi:hypothetical protein
MRIRRQRCGSIEWETDLSENTTQQIFNLLSGALGRSVKSRESKRKGYALFIVNE